MVLISSIALPTSFRSTASATCIRPVFIPSRRRRNIGLAGLATSTLSVFGNVAPLYQQLFKLVNQKDYFVITTNVDGQFRKAGFDEDRLFEVQGDYAYLQCAKGCHDTLYDNEELVKRMVNATEGCRIPSSLVPHCPIDGEKMAVHVRCDEYFVEDESWQAASERYCQFLEYARGEADGIAGTGCGIQHALHHPLSVRKDGCVVEGHTSGENQPGEHPVHA